MSVTHGAFLRTEIVELESKIVDILSSLPYAHIEGLVQERRNSSALAMELRLSCTNPSIYA